MGLQTLSAGNVSRRYRSGCLAANAIGSRFDLGWKPLWVESSTRDGGGLRNGGCVTAVETLELLILSRCWLDEVSARRVSPSDWGFSVNFENPKQRAGSVGLDRFAPTITGKQENDKNSFLYRKYRISNLSFTFSH